MKLQLDFDEKTIRIEEKVNLGELFNKLEEILSDLKWREFDLDNEPPCPTYPWITYK